MTSSFLFLDLATSYRLTKTEKLVVVPLLINSFQFK